MPRRLRNSRRDKTNLRMSSWIRSAKPSTCTLSSTLTHSSSTERIAQSLRNSMRTSRESSRKRKLPLGTLKTLRRPSQEKRPLSMSSSSRRISTWWQETLKFRSLEATRARKTMLMSALLKRCGRETKFCLSVVLVRTSSSLPWTVSNSISLKTTMTSSTSTRRCSDSMWMRRQATLQLLQRRRRRSLKIKRTKLAPHQRRELPLMQSKWTTRMRRARNNPQLKKSLARKLYLESKEHRQ